MVLGWQGKPRGSEESQPRLCQRLGEKSVPRQHLCVWGWGRARPCFVGREWPQTPQPGWAVNQSINHTPCGDNPASDWQSYPSITQWGSTDWPLVGQLTGRPTWADQWMPWGLKGGAHLSSDFWSFYFSHAGTLKVGSYIFVLSVPAVVVCFFTFIYWKLYSFY